MDKQREIRAILSGRIRYADGAYMAAETLRSMSFQGINNGGVSVSLFGIGYQHRRYHAKNLNSVQKKAEECLHNMGRAVIFTEMEEDAACLYRPPFGNPVVMTLTQEKNGLLLGLYTAKSPLAQLACNHAVKVFERHLPAEMRTGLSSETVTEPKEPREKHKTKKARKKAERWAKKAERSAKHTAKVQAKAQEQAEKGE